MKKLPFTGGIFFLTFSFLSFLVSKDIFTQLDFNTTVKIQDKLGETFVGPFSMFSLFGSVEIASIVLLLVLVASKRLKSIFVLFFYGLTGIIELLGKIIIEHNGPPILFLKTHLPLQFPSSYIPHDFYSYPSGHSARTAFVSVILIFVILISKKLNPEMKRIFIGGVLFFDFIMFISRVYLGEHWLTDVVGGALLGISLALISVVFILPKRK